MLDRLSDGALVLGAEARVLAGQDLAGVGYVADHQLGGGKGNFRRGEGLGLGFGGGHD